jgi:hypothetical protein
MLKFNKAMVDTLFEIRQDQSKTVRSYLLLTAPDIVDRLINLYQSTNNLRTKLLISKFLNEAGKDCLARVIDIEVERSRSKAGEGSLYAELNQNEVLVNMASQSILSSQELMEHLGV